MKELTLDDIIDMSHNDHHAALIASRNLEGWKFGHREDGVSYYYKEGVDITPLPVTPHDECMMIIEKHRPGTLARAFDAGI